MKSLRKRLHRLWARALIYAAQELARLAPKGSLKISHFFFFLFKRFGRTLVYRKGHRVLVLPGVASCWRDAVMGRERAVQGFLAAQAPRATGFLDCGANIGYFSCLAAQCNPQAKILAVEPLAECHRLLRAERRLNGFRHIRIVPGVLSEQDGLCPFERPSESYGESGSIRTTTSIKGEGGSLKEICGYSLDHLLNSFSPEDRVIVKVDIEGYEAQALKAPVSSAQAKKVMALCVEVHLFAYANPFADFRQWLGAVQDWFTGRWWMAEPPFTQKPLKRYWRRLRQTEPLKPLDMALMEQWIAQNRLSETYVFGVKDV